MSVPSTETKTVFDIFVDEDTKNEIKEAVPCDFGPELFGSEKPCPASASWIIRFRKICAHGGPLAPPHLIFLCEGHKNWLVNALSPGTTWCCAACNCPLDKSSHIVERISKI